MLSEDRRLVGFPWYLPLFPRRHFHMYFLERKVGILLKILQKLVPMLRINNFPALVQIMAWCRPCDKPLSEPMMVSLLTHICVARLQWVNREAHETASLECAVGTAVEIFSLSNLTRLGVLTFITKMSVSNSDHTTEGSLPLHNAKSPPVFQWPIQFKQRICMYIGMS